MAHRICTYRDSNSIFKRARDKEIFSENVYICILVVSHKIQKNGQGKAEKKLLKLEIRNKDQVKQVSDLVKSKAQNERIPYIISATTFGILFTPIWYSFIDKTFDLYKDQFQYLLAFFVGGTFLVVVISIIAPMIVDIRDNMLTKYNDLNALSEYLDDIHMEL